MESMFKITSVDVYHWYKDNFLHALGFTYADYGISVPKNSIFLRNQ